MRHQIKKLFTMMLVLSLCLIFVPSASAKVAAKEYHVKTVTQLKAALKHLNARIYLERNLNLGGKQWTPIGTDEKPFTGKFYGNGHTITGLKVSKTENNAGFFGVTKGAKITKLRVSGIVSNVHVYGGGIVGHATDHTVLSYCISDVKVSGTDQIGGIVGRISDSSMSYCMNQKKVTATGRGVGGVTADLYPSGTLTKCINLAAVDGGYDLTGGITGGSTSGNVSGCINVGNIVSKRGGRIGAIAGDNASYAGSRYMNYFLKTSKVNSIHPIIGTNCNTVKSKSNKRVVNLKNKILSVFK